MAVNISHIEKATWALIHMIDDAVSAIEDKENEGDNDAERIDAYQNFRELLEEQLDELKDTLENLK